MADGFTPIATPVRGISKQVFAAGIREALAADDTARAERLRVLWRDYRECSDVF